jgi:phage shock protein B
MDETAVAIVAIVFGSVLAALFIITNLISKMTGARGGSRLSDEESQLMQEIFYGMKKMEERVESLETILLDKGRGE